jgi:hypothetical protein
MAFNEKQVDPCIGLVSKSVEDLVFGFENIYGKFTLTDPIVSPMKFDRNAYEQTDLLKAKVGVIYETDLCETAPSIKNCLREVVEKLKSLGI